MPPTPAMHVKMRRSQRKRAKRGLSIAAEVATPTPTIKVNSSSSKASVASLRTNVRGIRQRSVEEGVVARSSSGSDLPVDTGALVNKPDELQEGAVSSGGRSILDLSDLTTLRSEESARMETRRRFDDEGILDVIVEGEESGSSSQSNSNSDPNRAEGVSPEGALVIGRLSMRDSSPEEGVP